MTEVGGGRAFRPVTNLAHELVHGWDAARGELDNRPGASGLPIKEYRGGYYENKIRGEMNIPLRAIYRHKGNNVNILNQNNAPIFYSRPSIELMIAN